MIAGSVPDGFDDKLFCGACHEAGLAFFDYNIYLIHSLAMPDHPDPYSRAMPDHIYGRAMPDPYLYLFYIVGLCLTILIL